MARKWTLSKAFAHYGTKARNHVWGWSAISEDGKTVALTIWEDEIGPDGNVDYFGHEQLANWRGALGNRDRIEKLKAARANSGGHFRVVMVRAKDTKVIPRSIAAVYPDENRIMRLIDLDEESGEFRAETVAAENFQSHGKL